MEERGVCDVGTNTAVRTIAILGKVGNYQLSVMHSQFALSLFIPEDIYRNWGRDNKDIT